MASLESDIGLKINYKSNSLNQSIKQSVSCHKSLSRRYCLICIYGGLVVVQRHPRTVCFSSISISAALAQYTHESDAVGDGRLRPRCHQMVKLNQKRCMTPDWCRPSSLILIYSLHYVKHTVIHKLTVLHCHQRGLSHG